MLRGHQVVILHSTKNSTIYIYIYTFYHPTLSGASVNVTAYVGAMVSKGVKFARSLMEIVKFKSLGWHTNSHSLT